MNFYIKYCDTQIFGKIGYVPLKEYNFGDVPLKERFFASYHRKVETLQVITIPSCSATKSASFYFFFLHELIRKGRICQCAIKNKEFLRFLPALTHISREAHARPKARQDRLPGGGGPPGSQPSSDDLLRSSPSLPWCASLAPPLSLSLPHSLQCEFMS